MKVAIVSDIHSNLQALAVVIDDIRKSGYDGVLCAGDIVGYGANPNECCALVSRISQATVFGNHEVAALTGDTIWMNPDAARSAKWTQRVLTQSSRDYLGRLDISSRSQLAEKTIAMYHGSIDSAIEYIYEDQMSKDLFESAGADVLILGHTHVPYVARFERGLAINPGSVGQPRDRDPRASYAVLDLTRMTCEVRRLGYDVEAAMSSIRAAGLPAFLSERLLMGR